MLEPSYSPTLKLKREIIGKWIDLLVSNVIIIRNFSDSRAILNTNEEPGEILNFEF